MTQYLLSVWHDDVYEDNDFNDADTQRMFAQVDAFNNEIQAVRSLGVRRRPAADHVGDGGPFRRPARCR